MSPSDRSLIRRRWFRFSLRTLLLAVVACSVWLGFWKHSAEKQRKAAARLQELGATVYYDFQVDEAGNTIDDPTPPGPAWLRERLGLDFFSDVVSVHISSNPEIDESDLKPLGDLPALRHIRLTQVPVSDGFFEYLQGLDALQELFLWNTEVTGSGLRYLKNLDNLRIVRLAKSPLEDRNMQHLAALDSLQQLNVFDTPLTDASVDALLQIKSLQQFDPSGTAITLDARRRLRAALGGNPTAMGELLPRPRDGQKGIGSLELRFGNYSD